MILLIDNIQHIANDDGYVLGEDVWGKLCPVSFHSILKRYAFINRQNYKLISSGHVYVLNYNENTYIPSGPKTYKEYHNGKGNIKELLEFYNLSTLKINLK